MPEKKRHHCGDRRPPSASPRDYETTTCIAVVKKHSIHPSPLMHLAQYGDSCFRYGQHEPTSSILLQHRSAESYDAPWAQHIGIPWLLWPKGFALYAFHNAAACHYLDRHEYPPAASGRGPLQIDLAKHAEGAIYMASWAPNTPAAIPEIICNPWLQIQIRITGVECTYYFC